MVRQRTKRGLRFIPAYAGNALENIPAAFELTGSSPHTRGTPARAIWKAMVSPVHPRIRGERPGYTATTAATAGSSPHTRGTLWLQLIHLPETRFIPAYAGNARPCARFRRSFPVHPRIRGERGIQGPPGPKGDGSSPHTRGTPSGAARARPGPRFIPAYAGNADFQGIRHFPAAVHPRIRGERFSLPRMSRAAPGSSPHTRGTQAGYPHERERRRFIPAYAGNASALDCWLHQ